MATLLELWSEWELQVLVLLSFMLQVFLFFFGGLRRRMTNTTLRLLLWLAYLVADFIAVYALGLLSHQKINAVGAVKNHQLIFLWTPFLLIHLGGQDTITAFSVEDNELWLRHLINLLVQVGLALYVFCKSTSHNPFVASTVFAFVAGIIKYGERTWALKCASKKALRSSSTAEKAWQFPGLEEADQHQLGLSTLVRFALSSSQGVNDLFVGRKLRQMEGAVQTAFASGFYNSISRNGQVVFKILEIELGMIYDNLYTKARVIYTWVGFILRLVTHVCLLASFVLFLTEKNKWHHSKADVAITYTLFVGAFCLDVCAIFLMVMMSPWTWAFLRSWKCNKLARAVWYVFKCAQAAKCTLSWSTSMGQYNFLSSCFSDNVISKMMNLLGANEWWRNFRYTRFVDVSTAIKKIIFEDKYLDEILSPTGGQDEGRYFASRNSYRNSWESSDILEGIYLILQKPLEEAIISLHIYTDIFLHRFMHPIGTSTEEVKHLVRTCRTLSEYMCYLLVLHPDMLPVTGSAHDVLEKASENVAKINGSRSTSGHNNMAKDIFLERLMARDDIYRRLNNKNIFTMDPVSLAGFAFRFKTQETMQRHPIPSLRLLVRAWLVVMVYAAGKSRGEANARHLSMGGELLTFIWLHLAHLSHGDMGTIELEFFHSASLEEGGRKKFILTRQKRWKRTGGLKSGTTGGSTSSSHVNPWAETVPLGPHAHGPLPGHMVGPLPEPQAAIAALPHLPPPPLSYIVAAGYGAPPWFGAPSGLQHRGVPAANTPAASPHQQLPRTPMVGGSWDQASFVNNFDTMSLTPPPQATEWYTDSSASDHMATSAGSPNLERDRQVQ